MGENEQERWVFIPADGGEPQEMQPGPDVTVPGFVVPTDVVWRWVEEWVAGGASDADQERITSLYLLLAMHAKPDTEKPAFLGPAGDGGG